jgi:hypothetical protein
VGGEPLCVTPLGVTPVTIFINVVRYLLEPTGRQTDTQVFGDGAVNDAMGVVDDTAAHGPEGLPTAPMPRNAPGFTQDESEPKTATSPPTARPWS